MSRGPLDPEQLLLRKQVEDVNTAFYDAMETADMDQLELIWLDGPGAEGVACIHPGWPAVRGRAEVLRSFSLILANMPYIQFFITEVDVNVAGDVAFVGCIENTLTALEDEEDPAAGFAGGRVVATNIFRRCPEGWRLWAHHASPVLTADSDDEYGDEDFDDGDLGGGGFPDGGFPDPGDPGLR